MTPATPAHGPDAADAAPLSARAPGTGTGPAAAGSGSVSASAEYRDGPVAAPASRDVVRGFVARLAESGVDLADTFLETARLVAGELVANALRHAPGPCRLELTLEDDRVRIAVSDTGDAFPTFLPRDPLRPDRHGLQIVTHLCDEVITRPHATGKTVYARLPLS